MPRLIAESTGSDNVGGNRETAFRKGNQMLRGALEAPSYGK
jgi:hypothetical protein